MQLEQHAILPLKEVLARLRTGPFGSAVHKHDYVEGGRPLINPMHIVDGSIRPSPGVSLKPEKAAELVDFELKVGDVILGRRGEMGRCALVTEREAGWLIGTGSMALTTSAALSPEYLCRFLSSPLVVAALERNAVGSTMVNLNQQILLNLPIAVPPLVEQRRIVTKLNALTVRFTRVRAELVQVQVLTDRLRQQSLSSAIDNAFSTHGAVDAGKLFSWSSGKFLPKSNQRIGSVPVFGGNGINGHHNEANSFQPTLVVGRVGAQCGNVHITGSQAWITDNAIFAREVSSTVDLRFALHVFRSANLLQKAAGTGQPYVNQQALNSVPYPAISRADQQRIGAEIDAAFACADRLEAEAARAQALLDRLEAAILAKAFRGELVPQNPTDEAVSALLEHIRSERAAATTLKRKRLLKGQAAPQT